MTTLAVKPANGSVEQSLLNLLDRGGTIAGILELKQWGYSSANASRIPNRHDEEWQFTDLSILKSIDFHPPENVTLDLSSLSPFLLPESPHSRIVFVNGFYSPTLSDTSALPAGVKVSNLNGSDHGSIVKDLERNKCEDFFYSLNTAGLTDMVVVDTGGNIELETPIHLLFITVTSAVANFIQPRIYIKVGANAKINLVENYVAIAGSCSDNPSGHPYFTNAVTEIYLEENATLQHNRIQRESGDGIHIGGSKIYQDRHSSYTINEINLGAKLYRHNLHITQNGEQTETHLHALSMVGGEQVSDTHSAIALNHPHGVTNQLHKCIIDGNAHCIFNGKVFVPKAAQLTNASQLNRNLLISPKARVNTKPELQITADNVKCSHGATVSQLSADEVFYLQSRGLTAENARNLLIDAFAMEILEKIPLQSLQRRLGQCVSCRS